MTKRGRRDQEKKKGKSRKGELMPTFEGSGGNPGGGLLRGAYEREGRLRKGEKNYRRKGGCVVSCSRQKECTYVKKPEDR